MEEGNPWVAIVVTLILIAINGVLASSEIALVGTNEAKLKQSSQNGDKKASLLLKMKQNPSDFLSTIQIGITLASLLSGAFAAESLATPIVNWAKSMGAEGSVLSIINVAAVIFITLIITYVMLVFGELVPKRVAMANPEKTARKFISPINFLSKVTKPLVKLLAVSTNGVLKLFGVSSDAGGAPITEDEIMLMVKEGHEHGTIEESEVAFVSNMFEFTDSAVEDAMTHRTEIKAISIDSDIKDVVEIMSTTFHSRFPVYEKDIDNIVGIIYTQDIVALYHDRENRSSILGIKDLMRKPFFVPESKNLSELFREMRQSKNTMAIVVDEYGGTAGIITLMDIIEEIVGDLEPTYLDTIKKTDDGGLVIDGRIEMEDLVTILDDLKIDEEDDFYDTLSGFVIDELGYIPSPDQKPEVTYGSYLFRADEMHGTRIRTVYVKKVD